MVPPVLPRLPGFPRDSEISRLHISSLHLLPQSLSQPLSFNLEGLPKVLGGICPASSKWYSWASSGSQAGRRALGGLIQDAFARGIQALNRLLEMILRK